MRGVYYKWLSRVKSREIEGAGCSAPRAQWILSAAGYAYGRKQIIPRALEAGAVDYIVKPFSPTELVARINAGLKQGADPNRSRRRSPIGRGT